MVLAGKAVSRWLGDRVYVRGCPTKGPASRPANLHRKT
jgi:hypothetical protein